MKYMMSLMALAIGMMLCAPALATDMGVSDQVLKGARLYTARCSGCHSIDTNSTGPMHRGVVGRKAGSVAGYAYSPALKGSDLVWTEANLDLWLQGPSRLIPGVRMAFRDSDASERAAIIAYLKTQK